MDAEANAIFLFVCGIALSIVASSIFLKAVKELRYAVRHSYPDLEQRLLTSELDLDGETRATPGASFRFYKYFYVAFNLFFRFEWARMRDPLVRKYLRRARFGSFLNVMAMLLMIQLTLILREHPEIYQAWNDFFLNKLFSRDSSEAFDAIFGD